jgi:signal peptidase I
MKFALNKNKFNKFLKYSGTMLIAGAIFAGYQFLTPSFYIHGQSMLPSISPSKVYPGYRLFSSDSVKRGDVVAISPEGLSSKDVQHPNGLYIKRIVGLPGDTLTFTKNEGNLVAINGLKMVFTPIENGKSFSLRSKMEDSLGASVAGIPFKYTDPYGNTHLGYQSVWDMNGSAHDAVTKKFAEVVFNMPFLDGQANEKGMVFVTVPKGAFFALSDNLTVGTDSRHFGFVPEKSVKAKLLLKDTE